MNYFRTYQEDVLRELANTHNRKKEKIIIDRLKEMRVELDLEKELKNPSGRFRRAIKGNEETYLFQERRIVTFVKKQSETEFSRDERSVSLGLEEYYY